VDIVYYTEVDVQSSSEVDVPEILEVDIFIQCACLIVIRTIHKTPVLTGLNFYNLNSNSLIQNSNKPQNQSKCRNSRISFIVYHDRQSNPQW